LASAGYPTGHVARKVTAQMVDTADLVLAADRGHLRTLRTLAGDADRVRLLRSFDPGADGDEVPDPYGQPDEQYRRVLAMLQAAAPGIVDSVRPRVA
jgi:protein-tyrosine phosphatase